MLKLALLLGVSPMLKHPILPFRLSRGCRGFAVVVGGVSLQEFACLLPVLSGRFDRDGPDSIGAFSSFQAAEGRAPKTLNPKPQGPKILNS